MGAADMGAEGVKDKKQRAAEQQVERSAENEKQAQQKAMEEQEGTRVKLSYNDCVKAMEKKGHRLPEGEKRSIHSQDSLRFMTEEIGVSSWHEQLLIEVKIHGGARAIQRG
jgi:hypothetical protein